MLAMSLHSNNIQNSAGGSKLFCTPCNNVIDRLRKSSDIDYSTIPGSHELPRAEVFPYTESLGPRAVSASGSIPLDLTQ